MPAVGGVVVSAVGIFFDFEAFGIGFRLRRHATM
jgi:hypothetical protein